MVVFRPFKHEVMLARITHQTEEGIYRKSKPSHHHLCHLTHAFRA